MAIWKAKDGTSIHYALYEGERDRPCLLMLHGLLGSGHQWQPYAAQLAGEFRLLLPDLRGHGRSDNQSLGLRVDELVADLSGLLEALNVGRVLIAGYDFGAFLGLQLSLMNPKQVKAMVAHGLKILWNEKSSSAMVGQLDPDHISRLAPDYAERLAQLHGAVNWRPLVRDAADLIGQIAKEKTGDRTMSQVEFPILVSIGDRDELVSLPEAHRLSRLAAQGSLLVLPGLGHTFPGEEQALLLVAMRSFFEMHYWR